MRVAYYCQHVLGIGHFHRSLEICRAIARHHRTTLIVGGPPVAIAEPGIQVLRLPGLHMDREFERLAPCNPELSLDGVKTARTAQLFDYFRKDRPDIFITELFPFGRKAFRFELDPLLAAVRAGTLPRCRCYCSVRDILVEKKTGRDKFEQRAVQTVNAWFDGILVHADPTIITLEETFGRLADLLVPLCYTGFVVKRVKHEPGDGRARIRRELRLAPDDKLIVASIGGGNVGSELLFAALQAVRMLPTSLSAHLQLFCGPYCDEKVFNELQEQSNDKTTVDRFTDQFPEWLAAADLAISMAGYNTCMDLVQAGIPALVYPFDQNREQRLRAERLGRRAPITIIEEPELAPGQLAGQIARQLGSPRVSADINLDGAEETARQVTAWYAEHAHHD